MRCVRNQQILPETEHILGHINIGYTENKAYTAVGNAEKVKSKYIQGLIRHFRIVLADMRKHIVIYSIEVMEYRRC